MAMLRKLKPRRSVRRLWRRRLSVLIMALLTPAILWLSLSQRGQQWCQHQFSQFLLNFTPLVREVVLQTDRPMRLEPIRQQLQLQAGDPLFWLPTRSILDWLMRDREIQNVALARNLRGQVTLHLWLRQPVAMIAGKQRRYVDADGVIFNMSVPPTDLDLPVITGIPDGWQQMNPNRQLLLMLALNLKEELETLLPQHGQQLSEINLDAQLGYSVFTDKVGGTIVFGLPPFTAKLQNLDTLLNSLQTRLSDIEILDLDYNKKAFVRFKHQGNTIFAGRQEAWPKKKST